MQPSTSSAAARQRVFWHRELPPVSEEPDGEHVVEARSDPVVYRHSEEAALHASCERSLRRNAIARLEAELDRLGGSSAHVTDEKIDASHDEAAGTFTLRGTFTYVLYTPPRSTPA
jgi:hypothetical protein